MNSRLYLFATLGRHSSLASHLIKKLELRSGGMCTLGPGEEGKILCSS
jgi:hypothetical protein